MKCPIHDQEMDGKGGASGATYLTCPMCELPFTSLNSRLAIAEKMVGELAEKVLLLDIATEALETLKTWHCSSGCWNLAKETLKKIKGGKDERGI